MNNIAGQLGKAPRGLGLGLKLLGLGGAAAYGLSQATYTGEKIQVIIYMPNDVCSRLVRHKNLI